MGNLSHAVLRHDGFWKSPVLITFSLIDGIYVFHLSIGQLEITDGDVLGDMMGIPGAGNESGIYQGTG